MKATRRCENAVSSVQKWKRRSFGERKTEKIVESAIQTAEVAVLDVKIGELYGNCSNCR